MASWGHCRYAIGVRPACVGRAQKSRRGNRDGSAAIQPQPAVSHDFDVATVLKQPLTSARLMSSWFSLDCWEG